MKCPRCSGNGFFEYVDIGGSSLYRECGPEMSVGRHCILCGHYAFDAIVPMPKPAILPNKFDKHRGSQMMEVSARMHKQVRDLFCEISYLYNERKLGWPKVRAALGLNISESTIARHYWKIVKELDA